jgi:hypothetical protein
VAGVHHPGEPDGDAEGEVDGAIEPPPGTLSAVRARRDRPGERQPQRRVELGERRVVAVREDLDEVDAALVAGAGADDPAEPLALEQLALGRISLLVGDPGAVGAAAGGDDRRRDRVVRELVGLVVEAAGDPGARPATLAVVAEGGSRSLPSPLAAWEIAQEAKSPAAVKVVATTSSRSSVEAPASSVSKVRAISSAASQKRGRKPPSGIGAQSVASPSSATWAVVQTRLPPRCLAR